MLNFDESLESSALNSPDICAAAKLLPPFPDAKNTQKPRLFLPSPGQAGVHANPISVFGITAERLGGSR